jgi:periplasmic copper chaperone A
MIRLATPQSLVLAALLAPASLPSAAAAHLLKDSGPADGIILTAAPKLPSAYAEAVDGNRSTVTRRSAAGQDVPLPPLAASPVEPIAVPLHSPQTLPMVAYTVGWHAVTTRTGRHTGDADVLSVSETDPGQAAAIRAEQAWARATAPQQKVGGAYVTLMSPASDRLVGVSSPIAGRAGVHEMRMDGNVMQMREVTDGLALPAGKVVALAPGGYHIMLMDLKQPLVAGQVIPMQLRFRTAPPLDVRVQVAPVGASAPPGAGASTVPGAAARAAPDVAARTAPDIEGHAHRPGQVH